MNASFDQHFSTEAWEKYAMGMLPEEDCKPLEEHLLICPACQDLLAETDEFIRVAKTALSSMRRRLSKPVSAALAL
jgi:Putative zinc-finger